MTPRRRKVDWTSSCPLWLLIVVALAPPAASAQPPTPLGRPASAAPEVAISFEAAAVVASELSPGDDAIFFSVAREPQGHVNRVVRRSGVEVVDALGDARFLPDEGSVPLKSVWAVVDAATGAFGVAAPPGFRLRPVAFPGRAFEVGAPGVVNRLRHVFPWVELLLVRPSGDGGETSPSAPAVWRLTAWDTSPDDRDGEDDDAVVTAVGDMEPLEAAGPPPPERFAGGDVLVVIDPLELRVTATRLLGPPETGGDS